MSKKYDVAVLGGGIVGQTLALLLARDRLRVALVAPPVSASTNRDVRAYALNHASRDLLQSLKVWPEALPGATQTALTPVSRMWVHDTSSRQSINFEATSLGETALNWIVDVTALEQGLAQALHYQSGIDRLSEQPAADLTVICEGKHSPSRTAAGLAFEWRPYPHTALATRVHCDKPHGGVARQWFFPQEILALLPLDGEQGQDVAVVWSAPHAQSQARAHTSASVLGQTLATHCDQALGTMTVQGPVGTWPLALGWAPRWTGHGVALAGDAAHSLHPLAGQGLNVGLGDVAKLAEVLQQREYWRPLGDTKLLRRYERARQAAFQEMACVTDGLFGLFYPDHPALTAVRGWGLQAMDHLPLLKPRAMQHAMGRP